MTPASRRLHATYRPRLNASCHRVSAVTTGSCRTARSAVPPRRSRRPRPGARRDRRPRAPPRSGTRPGRSSAVRVRQLHQAADDGYRSELVTGIKATADAERLATELAFATARLAELAADPPGAVRRHRLARRCRGGAVAGVPHGLRLPAARRRGPVRERARRTCAVGVGGASAPGRRPWSARRGRSRDRRAHDPRLPRVGQARRQPGRRDRRRAVMDAGAAL